MRITGSGTEPVTYVAYDRASSGGGTKTARLTVTRLAVDAVPAGCDAVLVAGDLQGVAPSPFGGPAVLLGVALADYLSVWAEQGLTPPPDRVAVVLAGDLYSAPHADQRSASGKVDEVWLAFATAGCPMIVGVAGNHDIISTDEIADLGPAAALLDGNAADYGGVRFAGVGGIIGQAGRPGRRSGHVQLALLSAAMATNPSVLVLHEGPPGDGDDQPGNPAIGARLRASPPPLTVCGHVHWDRPVARLRDGYIVNVDGRVVLLTPSP